VAVAKKSEISPICENRKARHEYEILETVEAGIALTGSEVKSLRNGKGNLNEAYVRFEGGEAWLTDAHIPPYAEANRNNHEPKRSRKLLLGRGEIERWSSRVSEKGLTAVPLRMYFKGPWVKLELALGRGKKLHDKRQALKEADDRREMDRALKAR
jgi:SsrA-binding protein